MREGDVPDEKKGHLVKTKAAELRLVGSLDSLHSPTIQFRAKNF